MKSKKARRGPNPTEVVVIQPKQSKASVLRKPVMKSWREAKGQDHKSKKVVIQPKSKASNALKRVMKSWREKEPKSCGGPKAKASDGVHIQSASAELEMRERVLKIWRETKGQEPMERAKERMKQKELLGQIDQVLTDLWEEKKMNGPWDFNCLLKWPQNT